ncbi:hypothetical protein M0657_010287 [Pyricularia oryzae]|nr:hypothetical protein M0657_010287 [Pyricularia oryzae]
MRRKDFGIKLLMNVNLQAPSLDPSQAPFDYVCSLKSKNTSDVQAQQRIPSLRHKQTVLAILEKAGPSKQVTEMLHAMEKALIAEIQDVEDVMGVKNPRIRELFNAMTA